MSQKVIDIFPPGQREESDSLLEENVEKASFLKVSEKSHRNVKEDIPQGKSKFSLKGFFLFFLLLLLIGGGVFAYISLPQATIDIWPKTENVSFSEQFEVVVSENGANQETSEDINIFPGIIFEDEIEVSQDFPSSGVVQKTERAKGVIRIFNAYSQAPQSLVANTRFVSADGKLFRSTENAMVPGAKLDDRGKLEPSFADVQVMAAEAGEDYNIGPSTFSIPGFLGSDKYTGFYGKSSASMAGGFRGEAPQVTEADLREARNIVTEKLVQTGVQSLKGKVPSGFVVLDDAILNVVTEESSLEFAGEEQENFKLRIKSNFKAFVFRAEDLENFAKGFINSNIASVSEDNVFGQESFWIKKTFQEESLDMKYAFNSIDWENGKMLVNLDFSARAYPEINESFVKRAFMAKSEQEIHALVSSQQFIERLSVDLWPFWVTTVPETENKVNIKINL